MPDGAMTVFEQVIALPVEHRGPLLDSLCVGRSEVRAEVLRMLAEDAALQQSDERSSALSMRQHGPFRLPDRIGSYRVLGTIGEGASGTVLRAEQDQPRREVALKLLQHGSVSTASMRRFVIEADALARLQHPGVVQIFEAGVADVGGAAVPFLATELVRGTLLHEWREKQSPDWRQSLHVVLQILDAVEYVHRQGVIHRDLKPQNVVVREGDGPPTVCILDFGVARLERPDPDAESTLHGAVVGTLAYMSPEQAAGSAHVDTRSDVWSTGAICYELLVNKPPMPAFDGELAYRIAQRRSAVAAPLGSVDPRFRGDLEAVVSKALALDPDDRYGSASAFADDLRRVLAHEPVLARRSGVLHTLFLFARRRRASMAAIVLFVVFVATTFAAMAASYREARASRALAFDVLQMVTRRVFELEPSLGTVALRRELLLGMEGELALLAENLPNDPVHLGLRADVLVALGNLEVQADRRSAAHPLRQQALSLRLRQVAALPDDADIQRELATDFVRLGDLLKTGEDPRPAREHYAAAQAVYERLVAASPNDARALDDLCHGCNRLAHIAIEDGDYEAAATRLDRQEQILARLLASEPKRRATMSNARSLWMMRAHLAGRCGDREQRVRCLRAALEFCDLSLDQRPEDVEAMFAGLSVRSSLACAASEAGNDDEARRIVHEARRRLAARGVDIDDARLHSLVAFFREKRWD